MLYDVVAAIISDILRHSGVPISCRRLKHIIGCDMLQENSIEIVCERMTVEGRLEKWGDDSYALSSLRNQVARNILLSDEYQTLGMDMLRIDDRTIVRYIPFEVEHRFFEIKPSTISAEAGLGLFLRTTRRLPQGCILCEYRGRALAKLPRNMEHGEYVVRLRKTQTFVDGITEEGDHLSLATFINDNGPRAANAEMMEYDPYKGRVFIVSTRDIEPGEEVFCTYGAQYWGFSTYNEIEKQIHSNKKKKPRSKKSSERFSLKDALYHCRSCGELIVRRVTKLHVLHCGDPLVKLKLLHLNSMPYSEFTAVPNTSIVLGSKRLKALKKAQFFVNLAESQTFAHTHGDVVKDLHFSWKEV